MLGLSLLWRSRRPEVRLGRLAVTAVGVLFVAWLVYAELFTLDAICLWCTGVHILTFLLFVTLLFGLVLSEPEE